MARVANFTFKNFLARHSLKKWCLKCSCCYRSVFNAFRNRLHFLFYLYLGLKKHRQLNVTGTHKLMQKSDFFELKCLRNKILNQNMKKHISDHKSLFLWIVFLGYQKCFILADK